MVLLPLLHGEGIIQLSKKAHYIAHLGVINLRHASRATLWGQCWYMIQAISYALVGQKFRPWLTMAVNDSKRLAFGPPWLLSPESTMGQDQNYSTIAGKAAIV